MSSLKNVMTEITLFNKIGVEVKRINCLFPELVAEQPRVLLIDGLYFVRSMNGPEAFYFHTAAMPITNVNLDKSLLQ